MIKKSEKTQQQIIFGVHAILELLRAKKRTITTLYTTKPTPKVWDTIAPLLSRATTIQYVTRDVLTRIAGTSDHQGIVAWATPFIATKTFFNPHTHKLLLMLDGIQDIRNMGAILRSAYCTNIDGVIITKKNSAPLSGAAFKASAGLAEHLTIYEAATAQTAVQELKKAGYNLYLATLAGENALCVPYQAPLCLIIGNEAKGISPDILAAGTCITIPQKTTDISYNASVAAGILLFLLATRIHKI